MKKRPVAERFAEKVSPEPNTGCWIWTAASYAGGYGTIGVGKRNRPAHRVSWELAHGEPPPRHLEVCHRCDHPWCVNPDHLFLGTHLDNMRDRDAKGHVGLARGERNAMNLHPEIRRYGDDNAARRYPERLARGERHPSARLTENQVREIRRRFAAGGVTKAALGREYGIDEVSIGAVIARKTWKHVADDEVAA